MTQVQRTRCLAASVGGVVCSFFAAVTFDGILPRAASTALVVVTTCLAAYWSQR